MEPGPERVCVLIGAAVQGDPAAWRRFFSEQAATVDELIGRSRSMGSFRTSEDDRRNVMARVFERLHRDDFRALRLYLAWQHRHPERRFGDWLQIVTTNVIRDYVSERLGTQGADGSNPRRLLEAWAEELTADATSLAILPHATSREAARALLEHARAVLPKEQAACLLAWLEGYDFAEIAERVALDAPREAERRVRAALARLRRHVGLG